MKIAHEAPKSIFSAVQDVTDYDYALVHLCEEDPEYAKLFEQAIAKGRDVYLDNSIFELGHSFDAEKFASWVDKLNPTWYIIPDTLEDWEKTCMQAEEWLLKYGRLRANQIGVVQGQTYEEIKECYRRMDEEFDVDMIAISFDYSYYTRSFPHPNRLVSWMLGRVHLLSRLHADGIINTQKPHHLLGASLPQEFTFYRDFNWIYSVDTSNPCVHGIKGVEYQPTGLWSKESQKLFTMINSPVSEEQLRLVLRNINRFRVFANGKQ